MTYEEVKKCFNRQTNYPFKSGDHSIIFNGILVANQICYKNSGYCCWYDIGSGSSNLIETNSNSRIILPIFRLNRENSGKVLGTKVLSLWFKHHLIPKDLDSKTEKDYQELLKLDTLGYITYENNQIRFNHALLLEDIYKGKCKETIFTYDLDREKLLTDAKDNKLNITIDCDVIYDRLLNCEKKRADIESYDEKMLTDPNRGHWDLWESQEDENKIKVELHQELIAKNPKSDIKEDGIIGIDFGTKSTVVVHQENSEYTMPMRVGVGHFSKKTAAKHYENPTVMEFINLEHFIEHYQMKKGRPDTSWEDITVSHTAFNSLMESKSEHYYSILSDLKQWAGDKKRQIRLKDKAGKDLILPSFLDLEEDSINPIELYAYYIGLYINNQHNGIYLDYVLSFPVTYEKEVQLKIVQSFGRGLKKSLPSTLHEDQEVMDMFRVSIGASEPAAYAICALQEYGFDPEDDEKVFYGVFDFGGGTTDFDFGIWREADAKERRYDYVIEHFAAGGDKYLGGENILELLAFEVFKANQDQLREEQISFTLPPECQKFAGSEILINDSQEAKLNMKQLMEKLRPLWEKHENYEAEFEKGFIKVNLFDKSGNQKLHVELSLNKAGLEKMIEHRIEKGVRNFFESLRHAFEKTASHKIEKVNILLAGNSSKSQIVKDLFERFIEAEIRNVTEKDMEKELFEVYPPLGTEEAYAKKEEKEISFNRNVVTKPTGKTGVAFGLVQSRKGGRIKVIDHNVVDDNEVKFQYYIGINKKGKFNVILDRETDYKKWESFIDAGEKDFEFYYTSLPEASQNQLNITQAKRKKCRIDTIDESAVIYIRPVSPTMLEYVVATEEGIKNEDYLSEIKQLELS